VGGWDGFGNGLRHGCDVGAEVRRILVVACCVLRRADGEGFAGVFGPRRPKVAIGTERGKGGICVLARARV
jgi:hypothetical protein